MNQTSTYHSPRRRLLAGVPTLAAALLGGLAIAMPAHSADFYGGGPYQAPPPYFYPGAGAAYRSPCSPCGCEQCGCQPCGCGVSCGCCRAAYVPHPYVPRSPVVERRVVEREFYERRYVPAPRWPSVYGEPRYDPFPWGYGGVRADAPYGGYGYSDVPRPPAPVGWPGAYDGGYGGYGGYGE